MDYDGYRGARSGRRRIAGAADGGDWLEPRIAGAADSGLCDWLEAADCVAAGGGLCDWLEAVDVVYKSDNSFEKFLHW